MLKKLDRNSAWREVAILVMVMAAVVTFALNQLLSHHGDAEHRQVNFVIAHMRLALAKKVAYARELKQPVQQFAGTNPMLLLDRKPANYAGEFPDAKVKLMPAGRWYFDIQRKALVYRVHYSQLYTAHDEHIKWVFLKVVPVYADKSKTIIKTMTLKELDSADWCPSMDTLHCIHH